MKTRPMEDNKNLYFIPILANAFESMDIEAAIEDAMAEIVRLGKLPDYESGFRQFEELVGFGLDELESNPTLLSRAVSEVKHSLMVKFALNDLPEQSKESDTLLSVIHSDPELLREFELIKENLAKVQDEYLHVEVQLFIDGKFIQEIVLNPHQIEVEFKKVKPGFLSVRVSNGRVLWEDEVLAESLIWSLAYPDREYKLAADTGEAQVQPTRTGHSPDKKTQVRIYPGLESGRLIVSFVEQAGI